MKEHARRLLLLAACSALAVTSHAQVTYTNSNATGSLALGTGHSAVQTFTGLTSITNMTWKVSTEGSNQSGSFNAYVTEWNTSTNVSVGPLLAYGGGTASLTNVGPGSFDLVYNLTGATLTASTTYALVLSQVSGNTFLAQTGASPGGDFFGSGVGRGATNSIAGLGSEGAFQTFLQGTGATIGTGLAYTMSVTGTLAAVPEPKAAAAGLGALFVAGLAIHRVRQRRRLAAAPLAA
jgi:hypothetical protein